MIKHAGIYDPAVHAFIYAHVIYEHVMKGKKEHL